MREEYFMNYDFLKKYNERVYSNNLSFRMLDFEDGGMYFGSVEGDLPSGLGAFVYSDLKFHCGVYQSGLMNGVSRIHFGNGDVYDGDTRDGKMEGSGFFFDCENNDWIFGIFEDDNCSEIIHRGEGFPKAQISKYRSSIHQTSSSFCNKPVDMIPLDIDLLIELANRDISHLNVNIEELVLTSFDDSDHKEKLHEFYRKALDSEEHLKDNRLNGKHTSYNMKSVSPPPRKYVSRRNKEIETKLSYNISDIHIVKPGMFDMSEPSTKTKRKSGTDHSTKDKDSNKIVKDAYVVKPKNPNSLKTPYRSPADDINKIGSKRLTLQDRSNHNIRSDAYNTIDEYNIYQVDAHEMIDSREMKYNENRKYERERKLTTDVEVQTANQELEAPRPAPRIEAVPQISQNSSMHNDMSMHNDSKDQRTISVQTEDNRLPTSDENILYLKSIHSMIDELKYMMINKTYDNSNMGRSYERENNEINHVGDDRDENEEWNSNIDRELEDRHALELQQLMNKKFGAVEIQEGDENTIGIDQLAPIKEIGGDEEDDVLDVHTKYMNNVVHIDSSIEDRRYEDVDRCTDDNLFNNHNNDIILPSKNQDHHNNEKSEGEEEGDIKSGEEEKEINNTVQKSNQEPKIHIKQSPRFNSHDYLVPPIILQENRESNFMYSHNTSYNMNKDINKDSTERDNNAQWYTMNPYLYDATDYIDTTYHYTN